MRVAVTGGTGFVGSHSVAELLRAGHELRLLARARDRVGPALRPFGFGIADVETVEGDVTDPAVVSALVEGCDAVLHAAAVFSSDARAAPAIRATNVRGTEVVLEAAVRRGIERVVYVSSVVALIGARGATLGPDDAPTHPRGTYATSKADAERVARRYQDAGAPVVISYPAFVMGPDDPYFGESNLLLRDILRGQRTLFVSGTCPASDVRDVARLHARLIAGPLAHSRYMAPTTAPDCGELFRLIGERTGRRIRALMLPDALVRPSLAALDAAVKALHLPPEWSPDGAGYFGLRHDVDDSRTLSEFGLQPAPLGDTIEDAIRWMVQAGHVAPPLAGKLGR